MSLDRKKLENIPSLLPRLVVVYLLIFSWAILLSGRLVQLQVVNVEQFRDQAAAQQAGFRRLHAERGDILDRKLSEVAVTVQVASLTANPREIEAPLDYATKLSPILGRPYQELYEKLREDRAFLYVARRLPEEKAERVRDLQLKGLHFQKESQRVYPEGEHAAHVIGFVGTDNEGLSGLEYHYNHRVRGQGTEVSLRVDARRRVLSGLGEFEAVQGETLVLNLDSSIQYLAETVLEDTVKKTGAKNASAVVMDPHTGEIYAMASYPRFDPHNHNASPVESRRNRPIHDLFEPGSVFKIVSLAGVLEEGLSDPLEVIDCRVGTLTIAGKVYREAKRSFEDLSFTGILAKSSNVGTIKLTRRLGNERLHHYIRAFGFGEKTNVDLPGEEHGLLRPPSQWSRISIGALSIGQELLVTPLQMTRAVSVVANGGYLVTPRVVRSIHGPEGDLIEEFKPEDNRKRILSTETTETLRQILGTVVEAGTGKSARLSGYSSGGKTGTAQKIVDGRYSRSKYVASFVGFAPLDTPALAAIVVVNEPKGKYYGGQVAAPAYKQIMEQALFALGVPSDRPDTRRATGTQPAEHRSIEGVSDTEDLPVKIGETALLGLVEGSSRTIAAGNVVTLSTDEVVVPDFAGQSLREVAGVTARLGLRLRIHGDGFVVLQRPPAGSRVARGTISEIFFSVKGNNRIASGQAARRSTSHSGPPGE